MQVTLYRAFPDAYRQSMIFYGDQLLDSLRKIVPIEGWVKSFLPKPAFLTPPLLRYGCQYIYYQLSASLVQGDINHVIDHAYGHLLHTLDAQKTVVTFHDAIRFKNKNAHGKYPLSEWPNRWVLNYNLAGICKAARVIFVSEASRKDFLKLTNYPTEKTAVIPIGVEDAFFDVRCRNAKQDLGLAPGQYLLHVGHTGNYKNIPAVLHVLARLRSQDKSFKLLKTGTAFTQEQKKLINQLNLHDHIVHLGMLERGCLPVVYQAADVLLFPSYDEGFGIPIIEAMASGLPIVASNRGSLPEVVGGAGILHDPEDHTGMVASVFKILTQPSRRQVLMKAGKNRAHSFSKQRSAEKTWALYQEVFQDSRKR